MRIAGFCDWQNLRMEKGSGTGESFQGFHLPDWAKGNAWAGHHAQGWEQKTMTSTQWGSVSEGNTSL